ncbi:hypothetical protein QTN94_19445 [Vibrio sp. M250220]|uniref:hypothetical protein n=1 Tax=Vibrio sp. M250220 TaxID=3020894 RepID=UPI002F4023F3
MNVAISSTQLGFFKQFLYIIVIFSLAISLIACGDESEMSTDTQSERIKGSENGGVAISELRFDYFRLSNGVDLSEELNVERDYFQINNVESLSGERCPEVIYGKYEITLKDKSDNFIQYDSCTYNVDGINLKRNNKIVANVSVYNAYEHSVDGLALPPISLVYSIGDEPLVILPRDSISTSLLPEGYQLANASLIGQGELTIDADAQRLTFSSDDVGANRIIFDYKNDAGDLIKGAIDITVQVDKNNTAPILMPSNHVVYLGEETVIDLSNFISDDKNSSVKIFDVKGFGAELIKYSEKSITVEYSNYGKYYLGTFVKDEDGIISSGIVSIDVLDRLSLVDVLPGGIKSSFHQTVSNSNFIVTFF